MCTHDKKLIEIVNSIVLPAAWAMETVMEHQQDEHVITPHDFIHKRVEGSDCTTSVKYSTAAKTSI